MTGRKTSPVSQALMARPSWSSLPQRNDRLFDEDEPIVAGSVGMRAL